MVDIIQDKRGFLWFGTEDGLNIYDGYRFEVIRNDTNDSLSISYNQITDIDYMWLNKNKTHFGVVVGDVSGKAMDAAMTAVMSSGMIFIETGEASSIQEAMTRVNRSLSCFPGY